MAHKPTKREQQYQAVADWTAGLLCGVHREVVEQARLHAANGDKNRTYALLNMANRVDALIRTLAKAPEVSTGRPGIILPEVPPGE
jgi:hypothetical protein